MIQNIDRAVALPPVAPLRMRQKDGSLYCRPMRIEALLSVLLGLSTRELVVRARIEAADDPHYIPSECVLYFVRRPNVLNDEDALRTLFIVLRQRVLRGVPVPARRIAGSTKIGENSVVLEIRDAVLHKFQEMLCVDRRDYDGRLDYYECRFNSALASLRADARRNVRRGVSRYEQMESERESDESSTEIKSALAAMRTPDHPGTSDDIFRSKLQAAISSLPPDEKRVIELLLKDIPIDSQDKEAVTIAKALGCTEKTVRNRRDRAFAKLRAILREEEGS